jgi:HlyD family type I secretion membrane fusion protein
MPNYLAPIQKYLPPREVIDAHAIRLRAFSEKVLDVLSPKPRVSALAAPEPEIENWIRIGAFAFGGLFGGFVLWASLAPIASAAIGNGAVKVETARKIVQHLDGGILREILVREGQTVRKGDVLFRLDSVDADADRDSLQGQLDVLMARAWRLAAQSTNSELAAPDAIAQVRPRFRAALEAQQRIFQEQRDALARQVDVWKRRKDQYTAQMNASAQHLASLEAQLPLLAEELKDARQMLEKGYGLKPRVLGLERQVEGMKGDIASDKGKTASLLEQVSEADAQILTLTSAQAKQVAEEMQEVQSKIADTQDTLTKSVARQGRRDVVAPVDGVTMNIRSVTTGGVVAPGGPLVDIVPSGEKMLVEARLTPTDIDVVRPDLDAVVRFVAYKQRTTPSVNGKVVRVSADALSDERTGASYYTATVEVPADELARAPHVKLYPGMPVEIAIRTGSRTLLAYLMQPITDSMSRSFRED